MALLNGFKETETEQQYRRGEIYYINNASKEHVGSEMKKDRPAVIVSCDANNKHSDVLEVVFLTSAPKKDLPTHVTIRSTGRKSEALCEQPTPVSVERINNFVGKASEKEMEQIDIALLIGLGIKLAGAENQSGGASRKSEQQIQSSVKDRSKEESEKMAEENQMLREELKKQQESTIRSEAECSAYKAMHEQLLKKLMERRDGPVLPLPAKGRQDKKRVHRGAEKGRRRTDSGNQGNAGKERRKASEEAAKKE